MSEETNKSEVARLMRQIDLETQAISRVFDEPAIVANHDSIHARYANLGKTRDELAKHIGDKQATKAVFQSYEQNVG